VAASWEHEATESKRRNRSTDGCLGWADMADSLVDGLDQDSHLGESRLSCRKGAGRSVHQQLPLRPLAQPPTGKMPRFIDH
jgi:hypothetical protein